MQSSVMMKILLFVFVWLGTYLGFDFLKNHKVLKVAAQNVYEKTKQREEKRTQEQEQLRLEEGMQEKTDLLYRLDMLLIYSNLKRWIPFINTEIFIGMAILAAAAAYLTTNQITGVWIFGLLAAGGVLLCFYLLLYFLAGLNYQRTEKSLTTFLNLLENYSIASDDLIHIFNKVAINMEDPVQTALYECYAEATSTGDAQTAMRNLQKRIEHEKFKDLVRNLEICSRYEANYAEIIKDSRSLIQEYTAYSQERKSIINSARAEIVMIVACCGLVFWMVDDFTTQGIMKVLLGNTIGNVLLLYCAGIVLAAFWMVIAVDKH